MADKSTGADDVNMRWLNEVVKAYGPFAFGVASFMLMWIAIVQPELNVRRLEFEQHAKVLQTLNDQLRDQERVNATVHDTAIILERVAGRLEKMQEAK